MSSVIAPPSNRLKVSSRPAELCCLPNVCSLGDGWRHICTQGLQFIAQGLQVNDVLVCLGKVLAFHLWRCPNHWPILPITPGMDRNPLTVDFRKTITEQKAEQCDAGIRVLCNTLKVRLRRPVQTSLLLQLMHFWRELQTNTTLRFVTVRLTGQFHGCLSGRHTHFCSYNHSIGMDKALATLLADSVSRHNIGLLMLGMVKRLCC